MIVCLSSLHTSAQPSQYDSHPIHASNMLIMLLLTTMLNMLTMC